MVDWATNHLDLTSPESMSRFNRVKNDPKVLVENAELRKALLDFIADFSNWDSVCVEPYLATARSLTAAAKSATIPGQSAHPSVLDPFAGGGAIPLEAARVGADAIASDLNPIPILLNRVLLEYIPRFGQRLAADLRIYGKQIKEAAETQLAKYYPRDPDGSVPIAYIWARTIKCEGPACSTTVPMLRSTWLAKKSGKGVRLQLLPNKKSRSVDARVLVRRGAKWEDPDSPTIAVDPGPPTGTVKRGSVTCPCCGYTTPVARVREQLAVRKGGADDAQLLAVVLSKREGSGRHYRRAQPADIVACTKAKETCAPLRLRHGKPESPIPDEVLPLMSGVFNVPIYGHNDWGSLFTSRQAYAINTFIEIISSLTLPPEAEYAKALKLSLALVLDRQIDKLTSLCRWDSTRENAQGTFGRQALGMVWDFNEVNPFSGCGGDWDTALEWVALVIEHEAQSGFTAGQVMQASATRHPLPDDSIDAVITDPPYYNAVPYADLSDFFFVWLKRVLREECPDLFGSPLSPKDEELCQMSGWDPKRYAHKTSRWYEAQMKDAMQEARRVLTPAGIGVVVFAHKSTAGWESQLQAMVDAGWVVTGSWPIDTEMGNRLRAMGSAALASSVHLVCRPRERSDGGLREDAIGDWRSVLAELPRRIHEWMPRLAEEGVVGADAIFACLGPALEIFSRYSRVEKASGEVVPLREYLEQVWAAVATEALSMIFRDADAAGLESDARFTAIVLWTLGAGGSGTSQSSESESEEAEDEDDDEEESPKGKTAKGGYTLEYDAARKIAQGLGVNLEQIDSVVEVKGDKARLRPVSERATTLFGKAEKTEAATKKRGKKATQKKLFDKNAEEGGGTADTVTIGEGVAATPGVTALDRVHQAMLLFAGGRAEALKRFVVEDGVGGDARFWKLAQSLSALYPAGSDEKRWVDGVLARKKSFGF